jgi:hypothetical protein
MKINTKKLAVVAVFASLYTIGVVFLAPISSCPFNKKRNRMNNLECNPDCPEAKLVIWLGSGQGIIKELAT